MSDEYRPNWRYFFVTVFAVIAVIGMCGGFMHLFSSSASSDVSRELASIRAIGGGILFLLGAILLSKAVELRKF